MWFAIILILAGILIAGVFVVLNKKQPKQVKFSVAGVIAFIALLGIFKTIVVIDAGEIGAVVLFGQVQEKALTSGIHSINPLARVEIYPSRLREFSATGSQGIEAIAKDGLKVNIEISIFYSVAVEKVSEVYKTVAKNIDDLENNIFIPIVRTGVRDVAATFSTEDIYSTKREQVGQKIKELFTTNLNPKGINVDSVLIRRIVLPQQVNDAIQAKLSADQEAKAMEFKKLKAAKVNEITIMNAKAQARSQEIINKTLTTNFLQHKAIEAYTQLANSPNTTFIVMPTSSKGTGIPLIINSKNK